MKSIEVKREFTHMEHGYPASNVTYYMYCDRCGSFDVAAHASIKTWAFLIGVPALIAAVYILTPPAQKCYCQGGLIMLFFLGFMGAMNDLVLPGSGHRCRKCGNTGSAPAGTGIEYPDYDLSGLDVPENRVFQFTDNEWGY